jgi:hypothetical protein
MNNRQKPNELNSKIHKFLRKSERGRRVPSFSIDKRRKFVIGVIILSIGLFIIESQFAASGIFGAILLSLLTDVFLLWANHQDIKENKSYQVFILPFFYSLGFVLFSQVPKLQIFISHFLLLILYAIGLYSLFLSQNIFVVSSIRTIQLLSSARIVSFFITLILFLFLTNIIFTLHITLLPIILIMIVYTYLLVYHSLWTYTLQKVSQPLFIWTSAITVCLVEAAIILWFWPSNPIFIALFLSGFFYAIVGLSHIWFEKRLFKGILWEYVWVGIIVFFILILSTTWGK